MSLLHGTIANQIFKMAEPRITVLMPVYNALPFLGKAIDSILRQTFQDFELLIIDDCSNDASGELISSYRDQRIVAVRNERNLGLSSTLNKGLLLARAELVARMDADDIAMPERLEKQYLKFQASPALRLLGTAVTLINAQDERVAQWTYPVDIAAVRQAIKVSCCFAHPSVMYRKTAVVEAGGYDGSLNPAEDYDLWVRLCARYDCCNLPESLLRYRIHAANMSTVDIEKPVLASLAVQHGLRGATPTAAALRNAGVTRREINDALLRAYLFWIHLYQQAGYLDIVRTLTSKALKVPPHHCSLRLYRAVLHQGARCWVVRPLSMKTAA